MPSPTPGWAYEDEADEGGRSGEEAMAPNERLPCRSAEVAAAEEDGVYG